MEKKTILEEICNHFIIRVGCQKGQESKLAKFGKAFSKLAENSNISKLAGNDKFEQD